MCFYLNSNAFISSTSAVLRTSNIASSFCNLRHRPRKYGKPQINSRSVISSALNRPGQKRKSNAKKQPVIRHADAEVLNESDFDTFDVDEVDDNSQFIHLIELDGDEEDDEDGYDDDYEIDDEGPMPIGEDDRHVNEFDFRVENKVLARPYEKDLTDLDRSDYDEDVHEGEFDFRSKNVTVDFANKTISLVNKSDFDKLQAMQTNFGDGEESEMDDDDDDDGDDEDSVGGVKAYDDNGMMVVDVQAPVKRKEERARTRSLLDAITTQPEPNTAFAADAESQPPIELDESAEYIHTVVQAADTRKANDIRVLRVSKLTHITSFIVIATGNSAPQIRAIANLIEEDLTKNHKLEPRRIDGVPTSGWILLDCMLLRLLAFPFPSLSPPFRVTKLAYMAFITNNWFILC